MCSCGDWGCPSDRWAGDYAEDMEAFKRDEIAYDAEMSDRMEEEHRLADQAAKRDAELRAQAALDGIEAELARAAQEVRRQWRRTMREGRNKDHDDTRARLHSPKRMFGQ